MKNDRNNLNGIIEVVRELNNQTFEISEFINTSKTKTDTTKIVVYTRQKHKSIKAFIVRITHK